MWALIEKNIFDFIAPQCINILRNSFGGCDYFRPTVITISEVEYVCIEVLDNLSESFLKYFHQVDYNTIKNINSYDKEIVNPILEKINGYYFL